MESNNTENKYIQTVQIVQQIGRIGCSTLKCKQCPLEPICDKIAVNSKDTANKWLAELYKKK